MRRLSHRQRLGGGLALVALLLWIGTAALTRIQDRLDPEPPREHPPLPVRVVALEPRPFVVERAWRGTVDVDERAVITAQATGEVVELPFREGGRVKRDDLLFRLDDRELRRELERLDAVASRLDTELVTAQRELRRQEELFGRHLTPERALDDARQRVATVAAQVRESEAGSAVARTRLNYTEVRAPFAATIQRLHLQPGELARAGSPVIELVAAGGLKAVARVPQVDTELLRAGMVVELEVAALGRSWPATIDRISPALDPATRSATVAALFPSEADAAVRPGMAVNVRTHLSNHREAIVVSAQAIRHGDAGHHVFIADAGRARQRSIIVGERREGLVRIIEGLAAGESVIVTADPRLSDGAAIEVVGGAGSR